LLDAPFLEPSRKGINFFVKGYFYKELDRYLKKALLAGSSLHGGLVGGLEGCVYWDVNRAPFSW